MAVATSLPQGLLAAKVATFTNAELERFFSEQDLPGSVVRDLSEFKNDPQVRHNGTIVEHEVARLGRILETRPAPLMSSTPLRIGGPSPARGEHTTAVLRRHGYSDAEIRAMQGEGVFGEVDIGRV